MNNQEALQKRDYTDILLDQSLDSGVPAELRNKSIDEIQSMIDSITEKNLPMNISKWDYAPEDKRKARQELEDRKFELFTEARDIKDDDTFSNVDKVQKRNAIFTQIDSLDFDPRIEPEVYDKEKYLEAMRQRELVVAEIEKNEKRKKELQIVIKNIKALQDREIHEVSFKMLQDSDMQFGQSEIIDFPVIYLPEGFIDMLIELDSKDPQEAKSHLTDLLLRINFKNQLTDTIYQLFISHLRGHKVVRNNLFKKAQDSNIVIELPRLGIPVVGLADSLKIELDNFYTRDFHEIVWKFPFDLHEPQDPNNLVAYGSEKEVVFEGSNEDYAFEQGVEENSHAFYFKENYRNTDIDNLSHARKQIKYHSKSEELNALYGILGAYTTKYGSEDNIPRKTYNALMNLIQMSVNERINSNS